MVYPTGLVEKLKGLGFEASFDEMSSTLSFKVTKGSSPGGIVEAAASIYEHDPRLAWKRMGQRGDRFLFKMSRVANWSEPGD